MRSLILSILLVLLINEQNYSQTNTYSARFAYINNQTEPVKLHQEKTQQLTAILKSYENQYHVKFNYKSKLLKDKEITEDPISANDPLDHALNKLLGPLELKYEKVKDNYYIISSKTSAIDLKLADIPVKGVVTDSAGQTLPGVSVRIKGTSTGTITDTNGGYTIVVPNSNSVLAFTYLGFKTQEITINTDSRIVNVRLISNAKTLEEVVVVGYGTQKKVTVTGAIASVKGEDIKGIPVGSVANTLVGRLPGLIAKNTSGEPGFDDSRLLIRGNNTFGDNSPLVVVDGVADRAGGFTRIDVNDIESVTILKDASAAIYGSRAANGVILVTTKRGKSGKTNIGYSFNQGFRSPTVLPNMVDAADYATAINDITRLIDKNPVPTYTPAEIQKFRDGSDPINYPNVDPVKESLRDHSIQNRHNLTISGGAEKMKFYTSLGYQYENNIFQHSASNYKQYNLRSNLDIQANDALKFYANLALRQEDRNSPYNGRGSGELWRNIIQGDPRQLLQYPNGLLRAVTSGGYNPLTAVDGTTGYSRDRRTYINADLGFNWNFSKILSGLGMDGRLSVDKGNTFTKGFNKAWSLYSLNNSTGDYVATQYGPTNALLNENMNQNYGVTANIRLLYNKVFNNAHNLSTFVAYEQYESQYDYLQAQRQNFVATAIDQMFAGDSNSQTNTGSADQTGRQNYFGRLDYSYNEKYLFQFNFRYDGSENFPKENRFGFFPGVSVGWRASEESFWKNNLAFVDYFKLKASWGKMGNDKIPRYNFLTQYTFGNSGVFGGSTPAPYTGIVQVQTANPAIQWEVATTYNIGFESKFLNQALTFDLDVFKQNRDRILAQGSAVVPSYAGLSLPQENVGSAQSKGLEASLGYNKSFRDMRFNVGGNISYAKSKIVSFNEAAATPEWQKKTGKPIGANWLMYDAVGIYRTQKDLDTYPRLGNAELGDLIFRDVDGNGVLDGNDMIRLGSTDTPEIIYGFTFGATVKQFGFNMLWQGAGNVSQYVFYEGGGGGIGTYTQEYFDNRWTPENPNSTGPRIYDREKTSVAKPNTYFLHNSAYLRLKNVELTYSLPKRLLSKLSVSNASLALSGFNLLTFTRLKDIDPEATANGQSYAGWFNVQNKVYNLGLNVTF